ncbi:SPOR domain-containing protein [Qipengyuania marisflavi]|uniref:Sporulation protein SsgA n=1 Tax=Qipengyuania marisflavi TaxID=2486356 RepID=A0A5S3PEC2_9SPHN|nr:SPOR domain-containing protein [Qipengyuania marisflavi]TMM49920.1 sporulation protein SsgA [Qipengyuania marisflavi]
MSGGESFATSGDSVAAARTIQNGPAADYPVVVGDPYEVDGVTYTPVDTMNYDEVGYTAADVTGESGITAAHHTLPLPSYIEVTELNNGRTALVRVERRGPMASTRLIALSGAAMAQLGISDGTAVRVRRVNPPEDDRAELRSDREAPLRLDMPRGLIEVLKRKLPEKGSVPLTDPRQALVSGKVPTPAAIATLDPDDEAATAAGPATTAAITAEPILTETPAKPAVAASSDADGDFAIQIGAFSVRSNADRLAKKIGGFVTTSGSLALVRAGPFATRGQATQALAKLRSQGYSDARIVTLR